MLSSLKTNGTTFLWIFAGGILLCYSGFYNGFPIVYPDTGTYIFSGFEGYVPRDRPLTYGMFLRHSSMAESLFWVILAQGFLCSLAIYLFTSQLLTRFSKPVFIALVLALMMCTNLSIYVSYLTPDVFTGIFWSSVMLLLVCDLSKKVRITTFALAWISCSMHNSNLLECLLLLLLFPLVFLVPRYRTKNMVKKGVLLAGLTAFSWLAVLGLHFAHGRVASVQQSSHIFFLARLHEMELLKPYLETHCQEGSTWQLCAYKDKLPNDFIWNQDSPANKDGDWAAHKTEYDKVINGILTTPFLLKKFIVGAINGTISQFFFFRVEDLQNISEDASACIAIKTHFPTEMGMLRASHQQHRNHFLDFEDQNNTQEILFFLFLLLVAFLATGQQSILLPNQQVRTIILFTLVALVLNAAVCATLSTVVSRYQGRMIWLPACLVLMFLVEQIYRLPQILVGKNVS